METSLDWLGNFDEFIATQEVGRFHDACRHCPDPSLARLLGGLSFPLSEADFERLFSTVQDLDGEGRQRESAALQLLTLCGTAFLLESADCLQDPRLTDSLWACSRSLTLSHEAGFQGCEIRFALALGTYACQSQAWYAAIPLLRRVVDLGPGKSRGREERERIALALCNLGIAHNATGDYGQAEAILREALTSLCDAGIHQDSPELLGVQVNLGTNFRQQGRYPEAGKLLQKAVGAYRARLARDPTSSNRSDLATALSALAQVHSLQREARMARDEITESLAIFKVLAEESPTRFRRALALSLGELGCLEAGLGNFVAAKSAYEESLGHFREMPLLGAAHGRDDLATTLASFGSVLGSMHDYASARRVLLEAMEELRPALQREEPGAQSAFALILNNLALTLDGVNESEAALEVSRQALKIRRELAEKNPGAHLPGLATGWTNLGRILAAHHEFPEATDAFHQAVKIYRALAAQAPAAYRFDLATSLNNLGAVLSETRDYRAAGAALDEALLILRESAPGDEASRELGLVFTNLGKLRTWQRQFREAARASRAAVDVYRDLAEREPSGYRPLLAARLVNLANLLHEVDDLPEAMRCCEEAVRILQVLAAEDSQVHGPELARALTSFGTVTAEARNWERAMRLHEEAGRIWRALEKRQPQRYAPEIATNLNNVGGLLYQRGEFRGARDAYMDSLRVYRELEARGRGAPDECIAGVLTNLALVAEAQGEAEDGLSFARQAVEFVEHTGADPSGIWLQKGRVRAAYARLLHHQLGTSRSAHAFCTVAALREGAVRSIGGSPEETLEAAALELRRRSQGCGRSLRILIAEEGVSGTLLGLLGDPSPGALEWFQVPELGETALRLLKETLKVFDPDDLRPAKERRRALQVAGEMVWRNLPPPVCEALEPQSDQKVLISGDSFWSQFPWEALRFGSGEEDWLGLHRALARWSPLSAESLRSLRPCTFGRGFKTAAVLCPWNAGGEAREPLPAAADEARALAESFKRLGYMLLPEGEPLLGAAASWSALNRLLSLPTLAVLHFAGHGANVVDEEVLLLHSGDDERPTAPFGPGNLRDFKAILGLEKLLPSEPLVVLNSCRSGRTRYYGGRREDLAAALLAEGAGAVIGSAFPVYDALGKSIGESLYELDGSRGMAAALVAARRALERRMRQESSRLWGAWPLLVYHGNPFAELPHLRDIDPFN